MDILRDFRHRLVAAIASGEVPQEARGHICELLETVEHQIRHEYRGERCYINSDTAMRNRAILREWRKGERVQYLARRYGLSRQRVYQIINGYD